MKRFLSAALACCIGVTTAVAPGGGAAGEPTSKTKKAEKPLTAAEQAAVNSGVLTAQEAQLGCKRMAGRMKIRNLELRGAGVAYTGHRYLAYHAFANETAQGRYRIAVTQYDAAWAQVAWARTLRFFGRSLG